MGNFAPTFLAFILNCVGIYIFKAPKNLDYFPYLSYCIFLFGIFFLLWDVSLRPIYFRRLFFWAEFIIQFVISMCLMELIMNFFWLPLEITIISLLPKIPDRVQEIMYSAGFQCGTVCKALEFFKWRGTLVVASYLLSIFFFLCLIHATRIVDFSLLRCGGKVFVDDSKKRGQKFYKKMVRSIIPKKHRCRERNLYPSTDDQENDKSFLGDWMDPSNYENLDNLDDFCECSNASSYSRH